MYGWETHVLLRHYLEQGLSLTAIAENPAGRSAGRVWCAPSANRANRRPISVLLSVSCAVLEFIRAST